MPEVNIIIQDKRWNRSLRGEKILIRKAVQTVLKAVKTKKMQSSSVAIVLANDTYMQELNHTYRSKNKPTNVLAFPADGEDELGDVILGLETIRSEAKAQGKLFAHHACHMIVHGCLHLLGYDHMSEKDAARMEAQEISLLEKLNMPNPYAR